MKYDTKKLDNHLNELFQDSHYPSVSICIRGPEGIIFDKCYGYADFKHTKPVNIDTVYGIASMSKSITALSCAILQADGKLNFSDPITKYFPDFRITGTPKESVTLRHLAMHTTGLPPLAPLEWSIAMNSPERESKASKYLRENSPSQMDTIDDIVDYISNSGDYEPLGAPGEYMSYSNDGYAILSYVVDKAAGMSLEEFMSERIFKPLGMTRSILDVDGSKATALADGNITELFELDDDGNLYSDNVWSVLPPFRGCACVKSTASDMTRYYQALSQGGVFEGKHAIPAEAVKALIGHEFPETPEPFYCFGLKKRTKAGKVICEHGGALHGVSTAGGLIMGGYSVVCLCNQGEVSVQKFQQSCYNMLLDLPLDTPHIFAIPNGEKFEETEMLEGTYVSNEAVPSVAAITIDNDGNVHALKDKVTYDLLYCGETLFSVRTKETPDSEEDTARFLIRNGQAWGLRLGTRIFQRQKG